MFIEQLDFPLCVWMINKWKLGQSRNLWKWPSRAIKIIFGGSDLNDFFILDKIGDEKLILLL